MPLTAARAPSKDSGYPAIGTRSSLLRIVIKSLPDALRQLLAWALGVNVGTNIGRAERRAAPPPVGAPSPVTAEAVWALVNPVLDVDLADLCGRGPDRAAAELTAKQALVVGLDAAVVAGRDRQRWTINRAFDALAKVWSPTFRGARATRSWDMSAETVKTDRRELTAAGGKFDVLWLRVLRD